MLRNHNKVYNINALAWYNGHIYANIWYSSEIIIIDEITGNVIKYLQMDKIVNDNKDGVLNGIGIINDTLLVTGKHWKNVYHININFR